MTRTVSAQLGICLLLTAVAWIANLSSNAVAAEDPRDVKIAKALKSPTTIEFINTPLRDVVDYLGDFHNLKIHIDSKALRDAKIGPETEITGKGKDIELATALGRLLIPLKLDYIVKEHMLIITSAEVANEWKKARDKEKK